MRLLIVPLALAAVVVAWQDTDRAELVAEEQTHLAEDATAVAEDCADRLHRYAYPHGDSWGPACWPLMRIPRSEP